MENAIKTIGIALFPFFLATFLNGCGKDAVTYENVSDSMQPEGQLINLPKNGSDDQRENGFAEGQIESLDETGSNHFSQDFDSEEYRATYGRSTAPLYPVYFDFDSSSIKTDQFEKLNSSAKFLLENESSPLVIEGNCDERGTADYNLALGEVRALNVKRYLANLGVAETRISTISFGSQRPLYTDGTEAAWAKNRRADLVIP